MRSIRNIAFSALLSIGAFTAITYTACNKDECKDVVCNNGGTCNNGACVCAVGYEGANCNDKTRDKFLAKWTGTDICGTDQYNVVMEIGSASNSIQATVSNPGGFGSTVTIVGTVISPTQLSFPSQSVGLGVSLGGTMTLMSASTLKFEYTATDPTETVSCVGNYTKL